MIEAPSGETPTAVTDDEWPVRTAGEGPSAPTRIKAETAAMTILI
jgi:hypothetical protein